MANFAVLDGNDILNIITADSLEIAEQVTGKECVLYTNEPAEPGGSYVNGQFIKKKPYPSWTYNGVSDWDPPVQRPDVEGISFEWNEEELDWVEI